MSNIGFALQFESPHLDAGVSLAGHMRTIRQHGFDYLVWMGASRPDAALLQAAQRESRTRIIAAQVSHQHIITEAREMVEYWAGLGVPDLLVDELPAGLNSDSLASMVARLDPRAMRISFVLPPEQPLDALRASGVSVAVDTGRFSLSGGDPAHQIRAASGSSPFVILHDVKGAGPENQREFVPLGEGELDWQAIFDAGEEAAAEWYIVGHRSVTPGNPGSLRQAATFLARHA